MHKVPYDIGDRLWVRETCATWEGGHRDVVYRASEADEEWANITHDMRNGAQWKLRHSIFMPRWASRLTLVVTDVRVQRLQDIPEEDAIAEGVECETCLAMRQSACHRKGCPAARLAFRTLWNSLNEKRGFGWESNPWVAATTFTVHHCNIDQMPTDHREAT